jgi:DNA-directed RNA polymerase subunit RPC12/RpoP
VSEEFCSSQLSTICPCGNPKEFDNYVCATCWQHVPEDLKKELFSIDSSHKDIQLKRLEAIAFHRNPDFLGELNLSDHERPFIDENSRQFSTSQIVVRTDEILLDDRRELNPESNI